MSPFLRFAAIQGVERIEDPTSLAPKSHFIAAQAIERKVGQIGKTQKAMGEFDGIRIATDKDHLVCLPPQRCFITSEQLKAFAVKLVRRFPPTWLIEDTGACFIVRQLVYSNWRMRPNNQQRASQEEVDHLWTSSMKRV